MRRRYKNDIVDKTLPYEALEINHYTAKKSNATERSYLLLTLSDATAIFPLPKFYRRTLKRNSPLPWNEIILP